MPKQQKYAVGTTVSKVFIDPNTQQPRIYSGKVISYNGTKKNNQYRVRYDDDGDTEDIGVRELRKIVDEGGSGKVRSDGAAIQQSSAGELLDDYISDSSSLEDSGSDEEYEHVPQKIRRKKTVRKGQSSSSGNATLEAIGVTTNHQHQDGSHMQQPSPPSKKRKQQVKKKTKESPFEQRIVELRAYKEKHGRILVKQSDDKSLYQFCKNIRRARNNPEKSTMFINEERIASLDALGFEWSKSITNIKAFAQRLEDLQAYKEKHGHVNVKEGEDKSLYNWLGDMRRARKHPEKSTTLINEERIANLDALGFDWSDRERGAKSFSQRIADLRVYKEKNGHVNVRKSEDRSLYYFCINMRRARKKPEKSRMLISEERIGSLDALGFEWNLNSGTESVAQQTDDRPQPSKKRKQRGQGKADTATKKKHVHPKWSAKIDKGCVASSDQMEASIIAKDAAALSDPLPTIGYSSGDDVSAVSPFAVSTTNALTSDNMDTINLITEVNTESLNHHPKNFASILLEEKGKRLAQVKQEMSETHANLKDVREDLDIANDTVTQQAVFTNAWQNKFEELAKLAEDGRVDGAKISEIRNRSISIGTRGTDTKDESSGSRIVPV